MNEGQGYRRLTTGGATGCAPPSAVTLRDVRDGPAAPHDLQIQRKVTIMPLFEYCQQLDPPCEGAAHSDAQSRAADPALERRVKLAAVLQCAGALMEQDADGAALLLDGVLRAIAAEWFREQARPEPAVHALLAELQAAAPRLAGRLRLALRAPHAQARLFHAWALLHDVLAVA
jgi:hypothetical protein